ncbi:cytochrome c peroxidase [Chryseobacterium culicis]|uniref:Cytochrome-c peroxidase n=1 Tax=Chryseobacterium culicis TaxID=680127 RepID=A0A2S9CZ24_CHRCI|nr:cytochrome c peroxidase [Chryseobacterium culicis]PRB85759.1 cytochrome-c peroxidase [Chryseobacterium culicis]PRB90517.1 cytochrome-c peroxidase [Chryseobacterium culicis]
MFPVKFLSLLALPFLMVEDFNTTPLYFNVPIGFPETKYNFKENPLSAEVYNLGKKLFHDPILSRNNTISCTSCHTQEMSFAHVDHNLSHGIEDKFGKRNAPALINLAWMDQFMWDGRINDIHVLSVSPINDSVEMDESLDNIKKKLKASDYYLSLFREAYGDEQITNARILRSLSQYLLMLVSANSKYDRVQRGTEQFTEDEQKGYEIFKANCSSCHTEPLFTTNRFENNGLPVDKNLKDYGVYQVTQKKEDRFKFKIPTLRNISYTYPYMHDGRFESLQEVIEFYNTQKNKNASFQNKALKSLNLQKEDISRLIQFLNTLNDKEFTRNEFFGSR